ncbi:hypothetical protein DEQ92_12340 [Haloferax sp. Atlit-6N]|nr:hypothetical protein DEQ92_12340 [Haloferax sp. Atlit-6N]
MDVPSQIQIHSTDSESILATQLRIDVYMNGIYLIDSWSTSNCSISVCIGTSSDIMNLSGASILYFMSDFFANEV